MPSISISDLFAKIGQLTIENELLVAENERMARAIAQLNGGPATSTGDDNVPTEVPSTVPGPDDDSGLV